jgi:hypothetical protein
VWCAAGAGGRSAESRGYGRCVATGQSDDAIPTACQRRVAVVWDLSDEGPKAAGRVELPLHVAWSEPRRVYDLAERYDRRRVYEQVLSEGTIADVTFFVRASDLIDLWDELIIPVHVRAAWAEWMRLRRTA